MFGGYPVSGTTCCVTAALVLMSKDVKAAPSWNQHSSGASAGISHLKFLVNHFPIIFRIYDIDKTFDAFP